MNAVSSITVPLSVVIGETEVPVSRLAKIAEGSIIELTSIAGEPVALYAAGQKIATGEVVIIDENFGLRVTKLLS